MNLEEGKKIVFFDGVCNLCNNSVLFIIKRDKKDSFRFASLQSELGQQFLKERNIDASKTDSIILYDPNVAYYTKSTAALEIASELSGLWPVLGIFKWLPVKFRDPIYNLIAANRYKWFGKKDQCMIPTRELQAKFVG